MSGPTKKRISYFYDAEVGNYHYGQGHPMKVCTYGCVCWKCAGAGGLVGWWASGLCCSKPPSALSFDRADLTD
jgi:hypothetical protein